MRASVVLPILITAASVLPALAVTLEARGGDVTVAGNTGAAAHTAAHHHKSAEHHHSKHHGAYKHKHHKTKKHHHKGQQHHAHKGKGSKHHRKGKHGRSHKGKQHHGAKHHARALDDELVDRAFDESELYELYARDFEDAHIFTRELGEEHVARDIDGLFERTTGGQTSMVHAIPSAQGSGAINFSKVFKTGAHIVGSLFSREEAEEFARDLAEEIVARAMDLDELD